MDNKTKNSLKLAIITMCFIQMGTNGIAPIISDIAKAFPEVSPTRVQFLMTLPNIVVVFVSLMATVLVTKFSKKSLVIFGLISFSIAGLGAFLIHSDINMLRFWAVLIGIGMGLIASISTVIINESFDGAERRSLLGLQNSAANIGSMIMTFAGGFLATLGWNFGYLVYLIGLPGILFTRTGVKKTAKSQTEVKNEKTPVHITIFREMAVLSLIMVFYVGVPSNIAMHVAQRGFGNTQVAGTMSTFFLLGGTIGGIIYGKIAMSLGKKTVSLGAACLALGGLLIAFSNGTLMMGLGCIIAGSALSFAAPACMVERTTMKGHETLGVSLMMASTNIGAFLAPVITTVSSRITGSDLTSYRFFVIAAGGLVMAAVSAIVFREKKNY